MSDVHRATSTPRARELVADALAEFDGWMDESISQGVAVGATPEQAARYALLNMREELADHLVIRIGVTLASWSEETR